MCVCVYTVIVMIVSVMLFIDLTLFYYLNIVLLY